MQAKTVTREQVIRAAGESRSVSETARRLGLCSRTMSGRTGRMLRSLVPELETMLGKGAPGKPSTESAEAAPQKAVRDDGCPYHRGLYRTLFIESNRGFAEPDALVSRLGELGHKESAVRFALAVLKNPNHQSNGGRSTLLTEGTKVKLIALERRQPTGF